jgi:hypothetical protein
MTPITLTPDERLALCKALETAALDKRHALRDAIENGRAEFAQLDALQLVRLERAAHIAWGLPFGIQND